MIRTANPLALAPLAIGPLVATLLVATLLVAGCASAPKPASVAPLPKLREAGLERVMGRTAAELTQSFGAPDLDQREARTRRLQFVGPACVLVADRAPEREGAEPTVRFVDARLPNGDDIDRASCVAALSRRDAAK